MADRQLLYFNGIHLTTGEYLTTPMTMDAFADLLQNRPMPVEAPAVQRRAAAAAAGAAVTGVPAVRTRVPAPKFDPAKLEQAGWGVIFAQNTDPAVYDALRPLLKLRKEQASRLSPQRYKEYRGRDAWQKREKAEDFLKRHGVTPGPVNPDQVPYYLLLVADPEAIIYTGQFSLDEQRAVGRIHFKTPEEYANYVQSVIAAESGARVVPRRAVVFAPTNDPATQVSCSELAIPLLTKLKAKRPKWRLDGVTADQATKARLRQLLSGGDPAALVLTASHGGFAECADPLQLKRQGALICQGYDRSKIGKASYNPAKFYLSGENIANRARIPPMITFHFACFGAGTPLFDQFPFRDGPQPPDPDAPRLAPAAFVAYLPQRLLGHPNGGALASIGHVERAWGFTFLSQHADDTAIFENALTEIMDGCPVGHAMQMFGERFSQLNTAIARAQAQAPRKRNNANYLALWTACKDARNYVIVGDPAVRLPLAVVKGG